MSGNCVESNVASYGAVVSVPSGYRCQDRALAVEVAEFDAGHADVVGRVAETVIVPLTTLSRLSAT